MRAARTNYRLPSGVWTFGNTRPRAADGSRLYFMTSHDYGVHKQRLRAYATLVRELLCDGPMQHR